MSRRRLLKIFGVLSALAAGPGISARGQPAIVAPVPVGEGLITLGSKYPVAETIERFEMAVRARGWVVFTRIDHAAAAATAGLQLGPRTVVVFGNPRTGTAAMMASPTLAIDLPLRALVWQDAQGGVWLTTSAAEDLGRRVYARHGVPVGSEALAALGQVLDQMVHQAVE